MPMSRLRARAREESGFTLIELLIASSIGLIILTAATMTTIGAARHNSEVAQRTAATQRGRITMDKVERILRSQVCAGLSKPVAAASANSITVYSDLGDGSQPIVRHQLTFDPAALTLTDTYTPGTAADPPVFNAASTRTERVLERMGRNGTSPVFRYFAYPNPLPATGVVTPDVELVPGASGLALAERNRIARIDIAFRALTQTRVVSTEQSAEMTNRVYIRLADPNSNQGNDPVCS